MIEIFVVGVLGLRGVRSFKSCANFAVAIYRKFLFLLTVDCCGISDRLDLLSVETTGKRGDVIIVGSRRSSCSR